MDRFITGDQMATLHHMRENYMRETEFKAYWKTIANRNRVNQYKETKNLQFSNLYMALKLVEFLEQFMIDSFFWYTVFFCLLEKV